MIQVDIAVVDDMVCASLGGEPVNYLTMSPDEARKLAQNLTETANMISPEKSKSLFETLHNAINDLMSLRKRD